MAYLIELEHPCDAGCGKRAVVELRNTYNATIGRFCRPCGNQRLNEFNNREAVS